MTPLRRDWLAERDFTLVLGAGFFGFFAHTGLLLALEHQGLQPRRIVGVSAGALAGGLWASGLPAERIAEHLVALRREEFWDPAFPWGGWLAGRKFLRKLEDVLGPTGVEHVEHCPTPFVAVAYDVLALRPRPLATGSLHSAILASCSVPLMFRPVWRERQLLVDGGVADRLGASAWRPRERVLVHALPPRSGRGPVHRDPRGVGVEAQMLVLPELPRVHPYALERGRLALEHAYQAARAWLAEPTA